MIDLTSTGKYYDPSEWRPYGVEYVKIASKSENLMENRIKFNTVVQEYLSREEGNTLQYWEKISKNFYIKDNFNFIKFFILKIF